MSKPSLKSDMVNEIHNMITEASFLEPISGKQIAKALGMKLSSGYPAVRAAIHLLRVNGIPIGSNTRGYWLIESSEELIVTLRHLNSRIRHIREAMDHLYDMSNYWIMD